MPLAGPAASRRQGDNEVVFVVSDFGGGWAAAAQFEDPDGLRLAPAAD